MKPWELVHNAEGSENKFDNNKKSKHAKNVNNVDCKAVESDVPAKLDSALGVMQAEIYALKSNAPALILSSNSPLSALPLLIGQFAGTQLLPPQTPEQLPLPSRDSQVLEAMEVMAAMTYMHYVDSFLC